MNWFNVIRKGTIEMDGKIHVISDKVVALGDKVIDNLDLEEQDLSAAYEEANIQEKWSKKYKQHVTAGGKVRDRNYFQIEIAAKERELERLEKEKEAMITNTGKGAFGKRPEQAEHYLMATNKNFAKLQRKIQSVQNRINDLNSRWKQIKQITDETNERNAKIVAAKTGNIFGWAKELGIDMQNEENIDEFLLYMNYRGYEPEAFEGLTAVVPQVTSVGTTQSEHMTRQTSGQTPFREQIETAIRELLQAGEDLSMAGQRYLKVQNYLDIGMDEWGRNEMMVVDEIYDTPQAKMWESKGQQQKQWKQQSKHWQDKLRGQ